MPRIIRIYRVKSLVSTLLLSVFLLILLPILLELPDTYTQTRSAFPWKFVKLAELQTDLPEAGVSGFHAAAVDGRGFTYMVSDRRPIIHIFDSEGHWVKNLERVGQGPGEFQTIHFISAAHNGSLIIYDSRSRRISHLNPEGGYVNSFSFRLNDNEQESQVRFAPAGKDNYWLASIAHQGSPDEPLTRRLQLVDDSGASVWEHDYADVNPFIYVSVPSRPGSQMEAANPAAREVRWSTDLYGSAWIIAPDYSSLLQVDNTGSLVKEISLNLSPSNLPDTFYDTYIHSVTDELRQSEYPPNREAAEPLEKALRECRNDIAPIQRMWWIDSSGLLIDRLPFEKAPMWLDHPGLYAALFPDGQMSEDVEGPGGIIAVSYGYALALRSGWAELAELILYKIESVQPD